MATDFNVELKDYLLVGVGGFAGYARSHPPVKDPASQIICVQPAGEVEDPRDRVKWNPVTKTIIASGTEATALELAYDCWRYLVPTDYSRGGFRTNNFIVSQVFTDSKPSLFFVDDLVSFANFRVRFMLLEK